MKTPLTTLVLRLQTVAWAERRQRPTLGEMPVRPAWLTAALVSAVPLAAAALLLAARPAAADSAPKASADSHGPAKAAAEPAIKPAAAATGKAASKVTDHAAAPTASTASGHAAADAPSSAKPPKGATPRQDPLDVLRDRLAARLGATPTPVPDATAARAVQVSSKATGEFHVPASALSLAARAPRSAAHAAPAGPSGHGGAGAADAATGHGDHGHAAWSYGGADGPERWGALKPEFNLCAKGQRQSPIDIRDGYAVELEPVVFDYRPSRFKVVNSGHSLQADLEPGNRLEISGRSFELVQFHFHNPAEERVNGRGFAMSAHLVHKDSQGRLAVVTVLFERGPAHPTVQTVWNHLPLDLGTPEHGRTDLNPADLLPSDRRYFTYMGSLTTPPCTEGVQWVVLKQPATLSQVQYDFFARLYPMNARPVQAAAGRIIKQSQ